MSTKPTNQEPLDKTGDFSATGDYDSSKVSEPSARDEDGANGAATADPTELLTSDQVEATGVFQPPASDATEMVPYQDAHGSTGVYEPAAPGATGVYEPAAPGATGAYDPTAPGATGAYDPTAPGATGAFDPSATSDATNPAGLSGTGDFDPLSGATGLFVTKPLSKGGEPPQSDSAPPADQCGRYVLKRFHAKGGMGEIWLAEDPAIGRSVALKRMLSHRAEQQLRFRVEAQITGQLEHPGIVPVHELGINEKGQPFYTMKFVRGRTLLKVIEEFHAAKHGPSTREVEQFRLLQIFVSLCQTVAYAHSRGVLHRDLKPENVMLGPFGETLLLDWGIAKVLGQPESAESELETSYVQLLDSDKDTGTRAGSIMGSPSYMSPEVAAGLNHEVDQRSDVYLLGGTLYQMLTGKMPRQAKNAMELILKAQREPPTAPRKLNPLLSKPLEAICLQAMAQRKEDRYQTALALAEDVQRYAAGEPVTAYQEGLLARAWRWAKRHRKTLTRSAAAVLAAALLTVGILEYRELDKARIVALRNADALKQKEQARLDLVDFRRLADETRFFAATTDPVSEQAPYFDPKEAENHAQAARRIASIWGPDQERLPLPDERDSVKNDLYDLYLLQAQARSQPDGEAQTARETLALLDEAAALRAPTRSYYRLRAEALKRLGEEKEAAAAQQRAEAADTPDTSLDHFLRGEQYRTESTHQPREKKEQKAWQPNSQRLEKAIDEYREALRKDPDHYWSHFQLGRCYLSLGRFAEAVEALGACVALRQDAPWGYSVRGFALAQQKRFAEAERDLNQAIEKRPDFHPSRLNRGVVYWMQHKNEKALADFGAVLEVPEEKRLLEAAYYRGQLYLQLGKVQESLNDFDRVVAAKPNFRLVYLPRARIHFARKQEQLGLADLNAYLAATQPLDPDSWQAYGLRGELLQNLYTELPEDKRQEPTGKMLLQVGLKQLQQAVALGGKTPELFEDLAGLQVHAGQANEALATFTRAVQAAPKSSKLLVLRGWLYDALGQRDDALKDFTEAVRVDPKNAEAHTGAGYIRALQKSPPDAQREALLALLLGAEDEDYRILHNVACIYATLSQAGNRQAAAHQDAAIALLRRAVKLWKKAGTGLNEIDLMKGEPAFVPLKNHPDFISLLRDGK